MVNPAVSYYEGAAEASVAWLAALLALQLVIAVSLWSFFVVRERRRAKIAE